MKKVVLDFNAEHKIRMSPFRDIDRYDTTASADVQQSFSSLQGDKIGKKKGIDRKPVTFFSLDKFEFFFAENLNGLHTFNCFTHICRIRDLRVSWDRKRSISAAYRDHFQLYP